MATATEIGIRALRRIGAIDSRATPDAADIAAATEALTAMINSWEADGLSGDILPLDARFEQGVTAMLAVRIAEEYGAQPGPILLRDADRGWAQIQAAFLGTPDAQFDTALLTTTYRWEINDQPVSYAWKASTDYDVRIVVQNNANLYECITAGTSAGSGGPTGTDADITDGTVHWCWRKVTA